jgi:AcrR family transcriptional regulator
MQKATRAKLHQAVFGLYSEPGGGKVTVRQIVKAGGVPTNSIYYWYGDIDTLYRLAATDQITALREELDWSLDPALSVRAALLDYARTCADAFGSEAYQRLLFLVVRDGAAQPWLVKKHQSELLDFVQATLARLVAKAGRANGAQLEIRSSAARAFVKRLQAELALPMLMPGHKQPTRQEVKLLTESLANDAFGACYSTLQVADAIGRLSTGRPVLPAPPPGAGQIAVDPRQSTH